MSKTTMPAWKCDNLECGNIWPIQYDEEGKEIVPEQCRKCRSRKWNSASTAMFSPIGGVRGGTPTLPSSEQFRRFRKRAGISQKRLAELIGISTRQVANIELGHSMPSISTQTTFETLAARHERKGNIYG